MLREQQAHLVTRGQLVCQAQLDQMEHLGQRVLQAMVGSRGNLAETELREHVERREKRERQENQEYP